MDGTEQDGRNRGRPRDAATVERDARVLAELEANGPRTRNEVADIFGLPPQKAYYALDRLRRDGKVRPCLGDKGVVIWSAGGSAPCP